MCGIKEVRKGKQMRFIKVVIALEKRIYTNSISFQPSQWHHKVD
jgi:hypothetical protein